jgi:nitrite reductase/ring-hydroxylating ferredoxin subunit
MQDCRTISEEESMAAVPDAVAVDPTTLPYAQFTSPASLAREQEAIFERSWLYVTHSGALQRPDDYVTARVGRVPLVLTRDEDGTLHALRNVCCHRGAEAVPAGCGNVKALQCRYHGWTYDPLIVGLLRSTCIAAGASTVRLYPWERVEVGGRRRLGT